MLRLIIIAPFNATFRDSARTRTLAVSPRCREETQHSNNAAVSKVAITKAIIILGVGLAHWI